MKFKILVVKDMEQLCINSDDLSSGSPVIDVQRSRSGGGTSTLTVPRSPSFVMLAFKTYDREWRAAQKSGESLENGRARRKRTNEEESRYLQSASQVSLRLS